MTAHIQIPALDSKYPATLSQKILTDVLRQKMLFEGVIISDDLEMHAVADRYSMHEMLKLGLLAGVDLFLICEHLDKVKEALDRLHTLVDRGDVAEARIKEALGRLEVIDKKR